jgi:ferredoxin
MLEQTSTRDLLAEYAGADMARSHRVTFQRSGITIDVAEDEYILEEAEDAGLHLPYDCRSGTCTTCIQKCLEGEIDQDMAFAIGDEELNQGLRLICIGSPLSDVVLDA